MVCALGISADEVAAAHGHITIDEQNPLEPGLTSQIVAYCGASPVLWAFQISAVRDVVYPPVLQDSILVGRTVVGNNHFILYLHSRSLLLQVAHQFLADAIICRNEYRNACHGGKDTTFSPY